MLLSRLLEITELQLHALARNMLIGANLRQAPIKLGIEVINDFQAALPAVDIVSQRTLNA